MTTGSVELIEAASKLHFEDEISEVKCCFEKIMNSQEFPKTMWQSIIRKVNLLCLHPLNPGGEKFYNETEKFLEHLTDSRYQEIVGSVDLLATYQKRWKEYFEGLGILNHLLNYVNLQYIRKDRPDYYCSEECNEETILPIHDVGLELWKKNVLHKIGDKLSSLLSEELKDDRNGKCNSPGMFQAVIKSLLEVAETDEDSTEFYREIFEGCFLSEAGEYYKIEAEKEIRNDDCSQYMKKVAGWMSDEITRGKKFLHSSTIPKLKKVFVKSMIIDRIEYLQTEFIKMISQEDKEDYANMYVLLKTTEDGLNAIISEMQAYMPQVGCTAMQSIMEDGLELFVKSFLKIVPGKYLEDCADVYVLLKATENGLNAIMSEMQAYITQVGCTAMQSITENDPELFVTSFLKVRGKYLNLINECFDSDAKFIGALDKACAAMLKCDKHQIFADKSPEVLAAYCDRIMKKHSRTTDESSVEDELSQAMVVFHYIQDKDIFQKLYWQMLCRRLLHGPAESLYVEEIMIGKLKQTCGLDFTRKYHEMFTDMYLKKDLNDEFSGFAEGKGVKLGFSFETAVLRTASWPCSGAQGNSSSSFAVPQVLEKCITEFETFYRNKYSGRRLEWLHHLSSAELKLCYLTKKYVICMTTYQMAILLLFEKADTLPWAEIKESTKLDDGLLNKALRSLTETKLLIADESSTDHSDSVYHLNKGYSNKKLKFKIPSVARSDRKTATQEEVQKIRESADDSRRYVLEAAIVRVMKGRQTLSHNALIQEVIEQVSQRFVPKISLIKRCIGTLIEREYLQRSPQNTSEYQYIA